jgi:Leucine-rich repeat (LRR) protein/predicted DNA-binding WGR domain protein
MKQYFEFKDEKSSKFWEISIQDASLSVRYGKIGTDGQATEKSFATSAAAQKEYDKLVKEKTKKGYLEIGANVLTFTTLTWAAFAAQFEPEFDMPFEDFSPDTPIRLYQGETILFSKDYALDDCVQAFNLVIDGNLIVEGNLNLYAESGGNFMLVTGNLQAKSIKMNGCTTLEVRGNVLATNGLVTMYGDDGGYLTIKGNLETKFILDGYYFNTEIYGDIDGVAIDFSSNGGINSPDFDEDTITEILVPNLFDKGGKLDTKKLTTFLREGKQILITDVPQTVPASVPIGFQSAIPQLITEDEANERFDLSQYDFDGMGYEKVILFDGDTYINENFDYNYTPKLIREVTGDDSVYDSLIIVNGNLVVNGAVSPAGDHYPHLLVLGNIKCDVLHSYDEFIYISGDAHIKYAFDGNYNDGSITIVGLTYVPYILNSDHHSNINPVGAVLINYYGNSDDFFEFDYTVKDFERIMMSNVFDKNGNFNQHQFIDQLKVGKSPLKKGAKPARLIVLEEIEKLAEKPDTITELDLSDKKLKEFPKSITKLTTLRKLVLSRNTINSIPAEIANLVNLEELYLDYCQLATLPESIGNLPKLHTLDVSCNEHDNGFIVLPESIGKLQSLRKLNYRHNQNLPQLPENLEQLVGLEELNIYQCSDEKEIDFPEIITRLVGLKKLNAGNNSFRTIPESILNLQNLEELILDSSLCYLQEFPDLAALKNLKILKANGSISYFGRPYPNQSLIKSFFNITSLEELSIDRHGEESNNWRAALTAENLEGISQLKKLKFLDLSFNALKSLPTELYQMQHLQFIDFQYDKLSVAERLTLTKALPHCEFDFRNNEFDGDENSQDVIYWKEMNALIKEANVLMNQKNDAKALQQSLKKYDKVLEYFSSGKVVDEYNLLYANYGKAWAYSYLTSTHKGIFDEQALLQIRQDLITQGKQTLALVPDMIWHYTDLGKFHEEVVRIASNSVAWNMMVVATAEKNTEMLQEALTIVEKGCQYVEQESQYFILDTKVRILLLLGQKEEAYAIVKRILSQVPSFGDFQDFKKNKDYLAWAK